MKFFRITFVLLLTFCFSTQAAEWLPVNPSDPKYSSTMLIYGEIQKDGVSLPNQLNYEMGVFCGDECRALVSAKQTAQGSYYFPLSIPGNDADPLTFVARLKGSTDVANQLPITQKVIFKADDKISNFVFTVFVQIEPVLTGGAASVFVSPTGSSNGSGNNSPADLMLAIEALSKSTETQKQLICAPGRYYLDKSISIIDGLSIVKNPNMATGEVIFDARGVCRVFEVSQIKSLGASRAPARMNILNNPVTLDGLIFDNGFAPRTTTDGGNGGALLLTNNVTVRNCVFRSNQAQGEGGAVYGGNLINCFFTGNSAASKGDAAVSSVLDNCTVVRNGKPGSASVLDNCTLTNSVVWGNSNNQVLGGMLSKSAIEGFLSNEGVKLASSNTVDEIIDGRIDAFAPRFTSVASGSENWIPGEYSPLVKVSSNNQDLGVYQSNRPKLLISNLSTTVPVVMYGNAPKCDVTFTDVSGAVVAIPKENYSLSYQLATGGVWSATPPSTVGQYNVKVEIGTLANWVTDPSRNNRFIQFTIKPRPIVVSIDNKTQYYGENSLPLTYQITGDNPLVTGDMPTGALIREDADNKSAKSYLINQGTLTFGNNYNVTFVAGQYEIKKRPIVLTAESKEKIFGEIDPKLTYIPALVPNLGLSGSILAPGDAFVGELTRGSEENVGTYDILQGTLGTSTPNYEITYAKAQYKINRRKLVIAAQNTTQIYGNIATTIPYTIYQGTLLTGHQLSGFISRETPEKKGVGSYKVLLNNLNVEGQGDNYEVVSLENNASYQITPAPLTINAEVKNMVYGNVKPELTYILVGTLASGDKFEGSLQVENDNWNYGVRPILRGSLAVNGDMINSNYSIIYNASTLTVAKRPLSLASRNVVITYGEALPDLSAVASNYQIRSGSIAPTDQIKGSFMRNSTDKSARLYEGELVRATDFDISNATTSTSMLDNYDLVFIPGNLSIQKRSLSITAKAYERFYGEPEGTIQYETSGLAATDQLTLSLTRENSTSNNVNTYRIIQGSTTILNEMNSSALDNYTISFVTANYQIKKRPVVITPMAQTREYYFSDPVLSYSFAFPDGVSGLTGDVLVAGTGDAFVGSLSRGNNENVGEYPVNIGSLRINSNYDVMLSTTPVNFTITPRMITLNVQAATQVYGDVDTEIRYTISGTNLANSDVFEGSLSRANYEMKNVGNYAIVMGSLLVKNNQSNYKLILNDNAGSNKYLITKRPISITAEDKEMIYGNVKPALTYKVTSGSLAYSDQPSGELKQNAVTVGVRQIEQGTFALSDNYELRYLPGNFTVKARPVTVKIDNASKEYGQSDPTFNYSVTLGNLAAGDQFSGLFRRQSTSNDEGLYSGDLVVDNFTILDSQGTPAVFNYDLIVNAGDFEITRRTLKIIARPVSIFYGEPAKELLYDLEGLKLGDQVQGSLTRELSNSSNVGVYTIQQGTLNVRGNYNVVYVPATYEIKKRPVVIKADAKQISYFDQTPEFTYKCIFPEGVEALTGGPVITGDVINGALTCAGYTSQLTAAGTYEIRIGSINISPNYQISYVPANLVVKRIPLTIKADAMTKIYGNTDPTFTYRVEGNLVNNDRFDGVLVRANNNILSVGTYADEILMGSLTVAGNMRNYDITYVPGSFTIQPRHLEITISSHAKSFGEKDPELVYVITKGTLAHNDVVTGKPLRSPAEHVGDHTLEPGSLMVNENYVIHFIPGKLKIQAIPLQIKAKPQTKIFGESDPALTYEVIGTLPLGETLTGELSRVVGENVGTYQITQGTLQTSNNIVLEYIPEQMTITTRPLIVLVDDKDKLYSESDPELTYKISGMGLVNGDRFDGKLRRIAGEDVGSYAIEQGSLMINSNYQITQLTPGVMTIGQAPVSIDISKLDHIFDRKQKEAEVITTPRALAYEITYNGVSTKPLEIGSYEVRVVIKEKNYIGEQLATLEIKAPSVEKLKTTVALSKSNGNMKFQMMYEELMTDTRLQFFNVRGALIYDKYNYQSGEYDMSRESAGTYYYVFTYTDQKGARQTQKGYVEILP